MRDLDWINAGEACRLLSVQAQTLYAYTSRSLIRVIADPSDARRSLYRRIDVQELAARRGRSRKLADIAAAAIAWGEPVLESAITTVRDGRCYYRGFDAVTLSDTATLESVAGLLIGSELTKSRAAEPSLTLDGKRPIDRLFLALSARAAQAKATAGANISTLAAEATGLLDLVADAIIGAPGDGPIHNRLAKAWGVDPEGQEADLIRRILVLLADHELNASTFAARVTASTGASLAASLLSGVAALSGPRHGGMGSMVMQLAQECLENDPATVVATRMERAGSVPGFGHPLYPDGDVRAKVILAKIIVPPPFASIQAAARSRADLAPNVDFALAAACLACGLPRDAPFALFATARTAGWLAHAIEQGMTGHLIRPRARYVGSDGTQLAAPSAPSSLTAK